MPFTPYHMGAALMLKPALRERFSVLVFGVSQVAIDVEPLVRIIRGDRVLHGWTHTLTGAVVIGAAAAGVSRYPVNAWIGWLRRRDAADLPPVSWKVAFASAWVGTGSHLVLDGLMHSDMRPFAPLTDANPLLSVVSLSMLHLGLVAAGVLGLVVLAVRDDHGMTRR